MKRMCRVRTLTPCCHTALDSRSLARAHSFVSFPPHLCIVYAPFILDFDCSIVFFLSFFSGASVWAVTRARFSCFSQHKYCRVFSRFDFSFRALRRNSGIMSLKRWALFNLLQTRMHLWLIYCARISFKLYIFALFRAWRTMTTLPFTCVSILSFCVLFSLCARSLNWTLSCGQVVSRWRHGRLCRDLIVADTEVHQFHFLQG